MKNNPIKSGIYIPNFGADLTPQKVANLAHVAEVSGWDGFFIWDHIYYSKSQKLNLLDPWVTMSAIAVKTSTIRFGALLTPLARRRPWKVARESVSLDHLSNGRLIMAAGLGAPIDAEYSSFGEESNPRTIAEKLDESLEILNGLWRGKTFKYSGKHYHLEPTTFLPKPLQKPRIPIWIGGNHPNKAPFRRAARWDGVFPYKPGGILTGTDIKNIMGLINHCQPVKPGYDIVVQGYTSSNDPAKTRRRLMPLINAGITWWLENLLRYRNSYEDMLAKIAAGPPRME